MLVHNPKEELFMIQDDAVEHYAKEHPEKLKEAGRYDGIEKR